MKVVRMHHFGDFEALQYEEIDTPRPRRGYLLVKVLAAGVNRSDHQLRQGSLVTDLRFPHIPGSDAVGTVAEMGAGVEGFHLGQRVIPMAGYPTNPADFGIYPNSAAPSFVVTGVQTSGTYTQFLQVPAKWVLKEHSGLPTAALATLPTLVTAAVRAVRVVGEVKAGQVVLVLAGASGLGSLQIQVARTLGARVAATVRGAERIAHLQGLGAELVIDTTAEDLVRRIKTWTDGCGADVVMDNLGGDQLRKGIDAVKAGGIVVSGGFLAGATAAVNVPALLNGQKQVRGSLGGDISDLKWALDRVKRAEIRPYLDHQLPLKRASEAHRLVATGQPSGSVVLLPWEE